MDVGTPEGGNDSVRVRYFGVSTLMFTSGGNSIMIDGFFSRPSLSKLLLGPLRPDMDRIKAALSAGDIWFGDKAPRKQGVSDTALLKSIPGKLSVARIFVSHSHFDHAMDVGAVAKLTRARISGSSSTHHIAEEQGVSDKVDVHGSRAVVDVPPFTVQMFEVEHGPTPQILRFEGALDGPLGPVPNIASYRQGINYAYWICHPTVSLLVIPSADASIELPSGTKDGVDVVFLGIGRLGKKDKNYIEEYWRRAVTNTGARLVIPIHWDDFTRGLDLPLRPLPVVADNMAFAIEQLQGMAKKNKFPVEIRLLPLFEPVLVQSNKAGPRSCDATILH
jgi:L-ascorbate metabolism protein UlaG (beta-lactamase superfamily)